MNQRDAHTSKTVVFTIEGNIGVGKTTLIEGLQRHYTELVNSGVLVIIKEPVDEWESQGFLQRMYSDATSRPAFQLMVLMSLYAKLRAALQRVPTPRVIITERSPWGNYHTFAKCNLGRDDLHMYEFVWRDVVALLGSVDMQCLYLCADEHVSMKRICARSRSSESQIQKTYLSALNQAHEQWVGLGAACHGCSKVTRIDADKPTQDVLCRAIHEIGQQLVA